MRQRADHVCGVSVPLILRNFERAGRIMLSRAEFYYVKILYTLATVMKCPINGVVYVITLQVIGSELLGNPSS